jgi:organic radical activating enzyme
MIRRGTVRAKLVVIMEAVSRHAKVLRGFPPHILAIEGINPNGPTFFGIHMRPACNFRCRKCFIGEQKGLRGSSKTLEKGEIFEIMDSARLAGAKVLGITGAGEPLMDGRLPDVVSKANGLGFITHIPTNASTLGRETAEFLRGNNVTLVLSLDSADARQFAELTSTDEKMFARVIRNIMAAQEAFEGTMETVQHNGSEIQVFRIAIHSTLLERNGAEMEDLACLAGKDTLMSVSSLANAGFASGLPEGSQALAEKHIVICNDPMTGKGVCGFFRFGIDMNFDGELLLDAHAIESRGKLGNIRDFGLDVGRAFAHLAKIKQEFVERHLEGFCPVRGKGFSAWMAEKPAGDVGKVIESVRAGEPILKFSYTNSGAGRFASVLDSPAYHTSRNEESIIAANLARMKSLLKKRVVVLGVGDGRKLGRFLCDSKDVIFVDISPELLEIACKKTMIRAKIINAGFEELDFSAFGSETTFVMLGGSLWNMEGWAQFLGKLSGECPGANFIAGLEFSGSQSQEETIKEYENEEGFAFIFHPMEKLGFSRQDGTIKVEFCEDRKRIEEFFLPNNNGRAKMARIGLENTGRVLLSVSIKLSLKSEMERAISGTGARMGGFDESCGQNHIIELLL